MNDKSLNKKNINKKIQDLRKKIEYYNYLYYIKNKPEISDFEYDILFKELQELEKKFPEFKSEFSPTEKIGSEPDKNLKKIKHFSQMLSLDAAATEKEVEDFHERIKKNTGKKKIIYVVEPKLDGFSVEIVYKNGSFKYGATRGDGITGEDISENLKTIKNLPLKLLNSEKNPSIISIRGEVFMSKKGFYKLNKQRITNGKEPFANPRNAAAGLMRQKDSKELLNKPLDIIFYDILYIKDIKFNSHWEILKYFSKLGLKTSNYNEKYSDVTSIKKYHKKMETKREEFDFEIDGIVIKLDDIKARQSLGARQRSPRWALAWKFKPKAGITTLKDIVIQVGKSGMLTPVALLDPVELGGVTVSRATLHNEDEVRRKNILPGDKVRIARAGDVIPEVVELLEKSKNKKRNKFNMPDKCPSCRADVYKDGSYYFCPSGLSCRSQLIGRLKHYASRDALDIKNLGIRTVEELIDRKMVKDMSDIYDLKIEDFLDIEGFADKSARQLYQAIQNSKNPRLDKFLYGLGIRFVGERVARILARHFKDLDEIIKVESEKLQSINEIGPEIAESIRKFFDNKENLKVINRFKEKGIKPKRIDIKQKSKLKGLKFVFTGELRQYTRRQAKELVENLGARVVSNISNDTDYLIVGDKAGSKFKKAEGKNINIIREDEFIKLIK